MCLNFPRDVRAGIQRLVVAALAEEAIAVVLGTNRARAQTETSLVAGWQVPLRRYW